MVLIPSRRKRKALLRGARMSLESKWSSRRKLRPQWRTPLSPHPLSLRGMQPLTEKKPQTKKTEESLRPRNQMKRGRQSLRVSL
uniref:Hypoxia up-regulated 1 n=1 Tax=Rousettus aegyptiacus TaxID=9407 RepID=A0A7J8H153_ROUAE|nr:hypoxia up-regulated 1 [Rousettus aegyptiacus]